MIGRYVGTTLLDRILDRLDADQMTLFTIINSPLNKLIRCLHRSSSFVYRKHVNRDRSGETLHCYPPREQSAASRWSPFLVYLPVPIDLSKRTRYVSEQVDGDSLPLLCSNIAEDSEGTVSAQCKDQALPHKDAVEEVVLGVATNHALEKIK